ncbi:hypothetical protein TNCT_196041 [Trichonephila clavata]|uniref:Uncharacterized protein n=1 Tax=Trichonephila clavata TaxID=2740835 RepID=A0A8X6JN74_TRICU|nr:hypothetical protein TNCT_196041 [Trichonephila clavata]
MFRNEYLALLVHRGTRRNDALEMGDVVLFGHGDASGKDSLPVEKTHESTTDHFSDSPTDYVPDSPVESTDNSEEKPPIKTILGRTIKIPRKLDL